MSPPVAKLVAYTEESAAKPATVAIKTENATVPCVNSSKLANKRLTATIQGMTIGTERRFLNAIRQFGYGIKPDTRILKDGTAAADGSPDEGETATAGEFALKYLIGQSIKRRKKMMLRKGTPANEVDAALAQVNSTTEAPATEKLDLRISQRKSKKVVEAKKDETGDNGQKPAAPASKKRKAVKGDEPAAQTETTGEAPVKKLKRSPVAPGAKRVAKKATGATETLAPAFVTPARQH